MNLNEKYGTTALIAGGSEGLGAAYAESLAAQGMDLLLVARRKEQLQATASRLSEKYAVNVGQISCDLTSPDALSQILEAVGDTAIDFLVYNAALSYIGPFLATEPSTHAAEATVNMVAALSLVHHFGGKMVERRRGAVIMMASLAGLQGSAYVTTYAATKAFTRVLAEGLWYEWKPFGVDVIACCAGATASPNYLKTNPGKANPLEPKPQQPEKVVAECLRKLGTTPSFISGTANKWVSFLMTHLLPRKMAVNMMGDSLKRMYGVK
ncbi:hypothetical protein SAMN05216436_11233 [bacterium A37T11]|nr:hypothetical protein SAMN05216436_11233 [bacterium A37T11]